MDRWELLSLLKGHRLSEEAIREVGNMSHDELLEGVMEYLLVQFHAVEFEF